jgi:hypothetical protein
VKGGDKNCGKVIFKGIGEEPSHPYTTEKNWLESGQILGKMFTDTGFSPAKLRDLHFDLLIALTARSHGALLITSDPTDFMLILEYREFQHQIW